MGSGGTAQNVYFNPDSRKVLSAPTKSRRVEKHSRNTDRYFNFFFYLITLIENISTYFEIEWCITAADSFLDMVKWNFGYYLFKTTNL